jgi:dUTP pyrophosphatase
MRAYNNEYEEPWISGTGDVTTSVPPEGEDFNITDLFDVVEAREDFTTPDVTVVRHPGAEIELKVSLLPHFEGLEAPKYQSQLASGFDIPAAINEPISLNTIGATAKIPTGIKLEVPPGFEAQVRPRSGLAAKHGITITNTPGTVDADYRGELFVLLTKVNMNGGRFKLERGMRIAQVVICPVVQPTLTFTSELSETERGEKGFGSTGTH